MGKNKKTAFICYALTGCIFLIFSFWIIGSVRPIIGIPGVDRDIGGRAEVAVFLGTILLPLTSLVFGVILGAKKVFLKWLYPIITGAWSMLIFYLSGMFRPAAFFLCFIPAVTGLFIGVLAGIIHNKRKQVL